jgi:hypothetical protein
MYPRPAHHPRAGGESRGLGELLRPAERRAPGHDDTVVVSAAGDLAYIRGRYAGSYDGAESRVVSGGRYVAVWQRIDGEWRIGEAGLPAARHPDDDAVGGEVPGVVE